MSEILYSYQTVTGTKLSCNIAPLFTHLPRASILGNSQIKFQRSLIFKAL